LHAWHNPECLKRIGAPCFVYLMVRRSYGFGDAE